MIRTIYSKRLLFSIGLLFVALSGCTSGSIPIGDEKEARKIAENYYALLQNGEMNKAVELFQPDQRGHWAMFLQNQLKELGPLTKYSFKSNTVNTVFSGKFYIFQVSTRYGDKAADEIVTLFLHVDESEIHLTSHKINLSRSRITPTPAPTAAPAN